MEALSTRRISGIWLVPIVVVAVAAWTIYTSYAERGVTVSIYFSQGKGIEAGKTEIRYKDVTVGVVESLRLSDDLNGVVATAVLDRQLEPYLGDNTDFWIVSAQVSGTSLRGLSTLLSGAYVDMDWPDDVGERRSDFQGLLEPPLTPPSVAGTHYQLFSTGESSLQVGSPVVYRGISVGRVDSRQLSEDYNSIDYRVFLESPFDSLVSSATRFYDVSGFSMSLSSDGLTVEMASLQTLATGGITFLNTDERFAEAAPATQRFALYANRRDALESQFESQDSDHYFLSAAFDDGVVGLEPGAPIVWRGVRLGTVKAVSLDLGAGPDDAVQVVVLDMQPARIGLEAVDEAQALEEFAAWVNEGMRAEVQMANLLTGKKQIALVERPESPPQVLDMGATPYPRIPSVPSQMNDLTDNVGDLASTLADLPLQELLNSAVSLLNQATDLLANEDTQAAPAALVAALTSIDSLSSSLDSAAREGERTLQGIAPDSPIYIEMTRTVRELNRLSRVLSAFATLLEENPNAIITGRR